MSDLEQYHSAYDYALEIADDITPARLAELRAVAEAATQGPWEWTDVGVARFDPPTVLALIAALEGLSTTNENLVAYARKAEAALEAKTADQMREGTRAASLEDWNRLKEAHALATQCVAEMSRQVSVMWVVLANHTEPGSAERKLAAEAMFQFTQLASTQDELLAELARLLPKKPTP